MSTRARHAVSGAVRTFEGRVPGYPWMAEEDAQGDGSKALSAMTKPELTAELEAAGQSTEGNVDELRARLRDHRAKAPA